MPAIVPLLYWKVLKEPKNGAKIAGKKGRKLGEVFQAAERMMHMQALEGIVGECDDKGVPKAAPAAAPAATPPASAAGGTTASGGTPALGGSGAAATTATGGTTATGH